MISHWKQQIPNDINAYIYVVSEHTKAVVQTKCQIDLRETCARLARGLREPWDMVGCSTLWYGVLRCSTFFYVVVRFSKLSYFVVCCSTF